ncbi:hypothetical protein DH2020_024761 [Rehmannia glutinosa]|uniref:Exocyst component Exo84 C-terminal domain-containing protein n=1 Tax=Rehmannia glutinosa TaxID=99300 RepID=A0ABR0W596_REHGL
MDSTSISTSRFRFRDHSQEIADEDSSEGHTTADSSSVSSDGDEEPELESMTAKGVQHLCSELLELKQESDEDFQKNIFSNYSAFLAILKEIEVMQSELLGLKNQASSQKSLIQDVKNGIFSRVPLDETIQSTLEETLHVQPSSPSILETHTENVSEMLDTLLSEHRLDDALALLEMEGNFVQNLQAGEKISSDQLMSYNSTISEKRAMLADQLTLMAKHPRVSAPELHKALFGLCQLGENNLANQLMLQYYHARIVSGIYDLQSSKEIQNALYIRELAKFVCSMISQAVNSFVALNGESYPYTSDLTDWAAKEIEIFALCFNKYVESISDISGGVSTAVDALQIAMPYCSLLENQRIGRKLNNVVPGLMRPLTLSDLKSSIHEKRTSVADDMSPLIALQMESSVLKAITDLLTAYIVILESALSGDTDVIEKHGFRINSPESPTQGFFILANISTLVQFSTCIIRNLFDGIHHLDFEIDNYLTFVQDVYGRLKACFLGQFISNIFSPNVDHESGPELCISWQDDSRICDLIPSVPYLFILDAQFLVEIARSGGYLSDNVINVSTNIISRLEESFISAGLNPLRDMNDGEWPANAATRALKKLQELHEKENATTSTQDSLPYVSSDIQFEDEGIESVNNPVIVNAQDSDSNTQASTN